MKQQQQQQQEGVLVVACRPAMAAVSANSQTQPPFPTPSPFSFSVASSARSRWSSSAPSFHHSNLLLRFLAFIFSFASALSLVASSSKKNGQQQPSSFTEYSELLYCFIVSILAFLYSAFQLFKGVCDIAHRGILISDKASDYLSFILDQLIGYLLISAFSVVILAIQHIGKTASLWKAVIISILMSSATFLVIATCTLLSGYKLCKRIIW